MPSISYPELRKRHALVSGAGLAGDFDSWINEMSAGYMPDNNPYKQGLSNNFIKKFSYGIDSLLESTPLPELGERFGGALGSLFDMEQTGREVGRTLPRQAVNALPLIASAVAPPIGLAGTALLTGADVYTQTDSPGAGVLAGGIAALLPGVSQVASKEIGKRIGGKIFQGLASDGINAAGMPTNVRMVQEVFARNLGQKLAMEVGGETASLLVDGVGELSQQALTREDGEPLTNPFTKEFLFGEIVGQIPFSVIHQGVHTITGKSSLQDFKDLKKNDRITREAIDAAVRKEVNALHNKYRSASMEQKENELSLASAMRLRQIIDEENQQLAKNVSEGLSALDDDKLSADEKASAVAKAENAIRTSQAPLPVWSGSAPTIQVQGEVHFHKTKTNYMIIRVADTPENVALGLTPNSLVGFPTTLIGEKDSIYNKGDKGVFNLPENKLYRKDVVDNALVKPPNPQQELPKDEGAFRLAPDADFLFARQRRKEAKEKLNTILTSIRVQDGSKDGALLDLVKSINDYNHLAMEHNLPVFDNESVVRLNEKGVRIKVDPTTGFLTAVEKGAKNLERREARDKKKADTQEEVIAWLQEQRKSDDPTVKAEMEAFDRVMQIFVSENEKSEEKSAKIARTEEGKKAVNVDAGASNSSVSAPIDFAVAYKQGQAEGKTVKEVFETFKKKRNSKSVNVKKLAAEQSDDAKSKEAQNKALGTLQAVSGQDVTIHNGNLIPNFGKGSTQFSREMRSRMKTKESLDMFNAWAKEAGEEMDFELEQDRFMIFLSMLADNGGKFDEDFVEHLHYAWEQEGIFNESTADLTVDFMSRPHIKGWMQAVQSKPIPAAALAGRLQGAQVRVNKKTDPILDFFQGPIIANLSGVITKLGNTDVKHIKTAEQFVKATGIPQVIMDAFKLAYPERFENGIDVQGLFKDWEESPFLETHVYGQETFRELSQKVASEPPNTSPRATLFYNQISPFDTKKYPVVWVDVALPTKVENKWMVQRKGEYVKSFDTEQEAHQFVAQYPEQAADLNVVQEGKLYSDDNRVLWPPDNLHENLPNTLGWAMVQFVSDPKTGEIVAFVGEQQSRWGQARREVEQQWKDAKIEKDPDDSRKWQVVVETYGPQKGFDSEAEARQFVKDRLADDELEHPSHPLLLPLQHTLVLKAVIAEAAKRGVKRVVVSDGETAMMTEGHDKVGTSPAIIHSEDNPDSRNVRLGELVEQYPGPRYVVSLQDGKLNVYDNNQIVAKEPTQSGGMRLHYDTTLPSAMRKLTGDEGEKVELGVHKNAREVGPIVDDGAGGIVRSTGDLIVGSPVFRNPDGTPKFSVTGRIYDISHLTEAPDEVSYRESTKFLRDAKFAKAKENFYQEKLSSLSEYKNLSDVPVEIRAAWHKEFSEMQLKQNASSLTGSYVDQPFIPDIEESRHIERYALEGKAINTIKALMMDPNPLVAQTAKFLSRYSELFENIDIMPAEALTSSFTPLMSDGGTGFVTIARKTLNTTDHIIKDEVLHELLHVATWWQLQRPTNAAHLKDMQDLHAKVLQSAPKHIQEAAKKLEGINFANEEGALQKAVDELDLSRDDFLFAYGLSNLAEFVSAAGTSTQVREFLLSTKSEKQGFFKKFVQIFKRIFGIDENERTLFDDFLETTDSLMKYESGYLTAHEYLDSYYKQQDPNTADYYRDTALKVLRKGFNTPILQQLSSDKLSPSQKTAKSKTRARKALKESLSDKEELVALGQELGFNPTVEGLEKHFRESLVKGESAIDLLDVLPEVFQTHLRNIGADMTDILDGLSSVLGESDNRLVRLLEHGKLREDVKAARQLLHFERQERQLQNAQNVAEQFLPMQPELAMQAAVGGALTGNKNSIPKDEIGTLAYYLKPPAQVALEIGPIGQELIVKGFGLKQAANNEANQIISILGLGEDLDVLKKTLSNPKIIQAVNKWLWITQKRGKENGEKKISVMDAEVQALLKPLTQTEKDSVISIVQKSSRITKAAQDYQYKMQEKLSVNKGARILVSHGVDDVTSATELASMLLAALQEQTTSPAYMTKVDYVRRRITPEAFDDLLTVMDGQRMRLSEVRKHFAARDHWITASRQGNFVVTFLGKNKKPVTLGAKSEADAKKVANGRPILRIERKKAGEHEEYLLGLNGFEGIQRLREIDEVENKVMQKRLSPQAYAEYKENHNLVRQFETEAYAQQQLVDLNPRQRTLGNGADQLPWLEQQIQYVYRMSHYWQRQVFRAESDLVNSTKQVSSMPSVQRWLRDHTDNLLSSDPEIVKQITKFTAAWAMAYNVGTFIGNTTQPLSRLLPFIIDINGGKRVDALKRVGRAMKEVSTLKVDKSLQSLNPDRAWLMERSAKDGERALSLTSDFEAEQELSDVDWTRVLNQEASISLGERASNAYNSFVNSGFWLFRTGERFNNEVTLVAVFDYWREQGLTREDAYRKAQLANHSINDVGGRANRPVGVFNNSSPITRGLAMLATSLQGYTLGTLGQTFRYLKQGWGSDPRLTPGQKYAARKSAMTMLGTQVALAGVLGIPFVNSILSLIEEEFPEVELNKNLRQSVQAVTNDSSLTNIFFSGLPSMFGWDLQSRLSLGNTIPGVTESNGFQAEGLLGAPAGFAKKFYKAVNGGLHLDGEKTLDLLPVAFAKAIRSTQQFDMVEDYKDKPLFKPTVGEKIGMALGINPKRLSDRNTANRIIEASDRLAKERKSKEYAKLADEVMKGNFGSVKLYLEEEKKKNFEFDINAAINSIVSYAIDKTFPKSLTETAGPESAMLMKAFKLDGKPVSQEVKVTFEAELKRRLGGAEVSKTRLQSAKLIDQLRIKFPTATDFELRRLLKRLSENPNPSGLALR